LEPNSLQLASPLTTQAWDIVTENPLNLTNSQSSQTMMPALLEVINFDASGVNEVSILPGAEALDSPPLFLSSPSPTFDLQQTLEAYFSQPNWQTLQAPELPFIQVVSGQSLGDQTATVDPLTGIIALSDTFVAQHASQPTELANLVMSMLSPDSLFSQRSLYAGSSDSESSALDLAVNQSEIYLKYLFSQSDWTERIKSALGDTLDPGKANEIAQSFLDGELSLRSLVQIFPAEVLSGTNGVFDASTGQIYLSDTFVVENINNPSALTMVLLEEFGHYLDAQLNLADSVGDEGEIFAYIAQGIALSEPELTAMKADDDRITITLDNQEHAVEHSTPVTGLPSGPDLVPITATTVYSRPLSLSGIYPVSWSIGNFGDRGPSQYWIDGLYASNDPFFDSSDFKVDTWFFPGDYLKGNLQPGHFYSRYRIAENYSWTPRRQFLLLVVDSQNVIAETNEYNNVRVFEVGPLLGNFDNIPLPSELQKAEDVAQNSYNHLPACGGPAVKGFNSDVELHTGAVVETHDLVSYKSLGSDRGLGLRYNSLHADPRPILHFGYSDVKGQAGKEQLLIAKLSVEHGEFDYDVPGYEGSQYGLTGGEHFWKVPQSSDGKAIRVDASLQIDLRNQSTGVYEYELQRSIQTVNTASPQFSTLGKTETGEITVINRVNSAFGSGWSLDGWKELVINPDQSVLMVDGSGSQRIYEAPKTVGGAYVSDDHDPSILEKLPDGTFRITQKDKTVYRFNSQNMLSETQEVDGEVTRYQYDASGQLTGIVDPAGLKTTFTYEGSRITQIQDPAGRITHLSYDAAGNLIRITDPDGAQRTWEYDAEHHMIAEVDARGNREQSVYDFAGRASQATRKDGSVVKIAPVAVKGLYRPEETINPFAAPVAYSPTDAEAKNPEAIYTDGNGNVVNNTLNQAGQTVSSSDGVGLIGTIQRNDKDQVSQVTNGRGFATNYFYNTQGNLSEIKDSLSGSVGQRFTYDAFFNNVTSSTDELGHQTLYNFDSSNGNLLSATRVVGDVGGGDDLVTQFSYLNYGLVDTLTDPLGRITDFDYDAIGRMTRVTYAKGTAQQASEQFEYDLAGNQIAYIDANGNRTELVYDARNRVIQTTGADPDGKGPQKSPVMSYTYDKAGNLVSKTDALGNTTRYEYDSMGHLTKILEADPDGKGALDAPVTQYEYDKGGNLIKVTDAKNHSTQFKYDVRNRVVQSTDALGNTAQYSYDLDNNLTSVTSPLGYKTVWEYDARNRRVRAIDPLGQVTKFGYNAVNQLVQVTDANNSTTQYRFDALDRLFQVVDPLNQLTTYGYDKVGNLTALTDALGRTTRLEYDALNRQTGAVDYLNQRSSKTYDVLGNVIATTDALNQTTRYGYDALNRLITQTDPLKGLTQYDYDANGNLLSLTDPEKNRTTYEYDRLNRLIEDKNATGDRMTYGYDAVGNLVAITDRNKRDITFSYDALDRQTSENWLGKKGEVLESIQSAYDADSRLTGIRDSHSAYTYTYDANSRVTSVDNTGTPGVPTVKLDYRYDVVGNRLSTTDTISGVQKGITSYKYDALDRMIQVNQSGAGVAQKRVDMSYNAVSDLTEIKRYGDLAGTQGVATSTYSYDALGRLTQLKHAQSATTLADYQLSYDAKNRLTQLKSKDGVSNYSYDSNDQITGVDHSYQTDETYSYDANGNRIDRGSKANKNNQLQSDANFNYHYDKQGNLIRKHAKGTGEETEYTWDYRNRLTQVIVKRKGRIAEQVDYTYDAFDRRIAKAVDPDGEGRAQTETERFVYDGAHIALVFDGKGQQTHRYLYGPQIDQVLADETVTGAVQWALSDQQGSVRDVINSQGQLLNHIRYDSFGNITSQTNANVDFRFGYTGREFDEETGLYYYRARYYDASIGRFISEDPMGFGAGDSNLYRYVGNSATNYTDPTGNFMIPWYVGVTATLVGSMTIAGALYPNPAQTPTTPCDNDPTDNAGKRAVVEFISSLGLGILSNLVKGVASSILKNLSRPRELERSLGSTAGHEYAGEILEGGTGRAYAGHGFYQAGSGSTVVPEGTAITLPRDGIRITERTGQFIERGDWEGLAELARRDPRIADDIEGMATYLPGAKIDNYTLTAPIHPPLSIYEKSSTVDLSTKLSDLLSPNMGCISWAACTVFKR
jgi:RHS repeat-associated protein